MKDHEGYLPKGWMMHEPYNLHNGTPALALYTYLYRTTRKNEWQGSLQTLADLVEIPLRTVRTNLSRLQSRGLVSITPLAYSHYSIKAQRLITNDEKTVQSGSRFMAAANREVGISGTVVDICGTTVGISGTEVGISGTPIKDNINIKENIKERRRRSIEEGGAAPAAAPAAEMILDRKLYISKVLAYRLPEYPYAVVYEYASLVQIPSEVVDDFLTHYASTGWKMNNGGRVENWAAALMNWFKRAKRFAERDKKITHWGQTPLCKNEQMSEKNRAIYEAEQEQKRRRRELLDRQQEDAISYEEYCASLRSSQ